MPWCPDRIAVEEIFISHFYFKFVWIVYNPGTQGKGKKFANLAVIKIYFNNMRKLSTEKIFEKDKEKNNSI